eukprot:XP_011431049.1 PREDICTED: uncharacterized protein LOC105330829 [Crassostrea gigas]
MGECIFLLFMCLCLSVSKSIDNNDIGCCGRNDNGSCTYCCVNYIWINLTCVECEGSYGKNCTEICTYPYFGSRCSQECQCNESFCDPVIGCVPDIVDMDLKKNVTGLNDDATDTPIDDSYYLRSVVAAISVALCVSFFTIVLLLVLLYRRQQNKQTQAVESHELQTAGETMDESEQCTRQMKMNSYRHVGSVVGRPLPENTNEAHFYQDVEDNNTTDPCKGTNTDELAQEEKTTSYEYQKLLFGEGESGL